MHNNSRFILVSCYLGLSLVLLIYFTRKIQCSLALLATIVETRLGLPRTCNVAAAAATAEQQHSSTEQHSRAAESG